MTPSRHHPSSPPGPQRGTRCLVCLKPIRAGEVLFEVFRDGSRHQLCCASCAAKFDANPHQYLVT